MGHVGQEGPPGHQQAVLVRMREMQVQPRAYRAWSPAGGMGGRATFTGNASYFRDPTELETNFSTVIGKGGVNLSCRNPLDQSSPWVGKDAETDEEVSIEAEVIQDDMTRIGAELAMLQISRFICI